MKPSLNIANTILRIEETFGLEISNYTLPPEGADSLIISVKLEDNKEYVIKIGGGSESDAQVLKDLESYDVDTPKCIFAQPVSFEESEEFVLIMSKVPGTLLRYIDLSERYKYIPQVIEEMRRYQQLKSNFSGKYLKVRDGKPEPFIDSLVEMFKDESSKLDWKRIEIIGNINLELINKARRIVVNNLQHIKLESFSLLHCDMHQSNVFVDNGVVTGIIDWTYAQYGDSLYDFALFHFNILKHMDENALNSYYSALNLNDKDSKKERMYLLCWALENIYEYILDEDLERISFAVKVISDTLKEIEKFDI